MGVRFACHRCGKSLNVKSELAGKRGVCPKCRGRFRIPEGDADRSLPIPAEGDAAGASVVAESGSAEPVSAEPVSQAAATPGSSPAGDSPSLLERSPEATWYVRPPGGGQYGPADSPTLRLWIDEGRVVSSALLWRDGWAQWREAGQVLPELGDRLPEEGGHVVASAGTPGDESRQPTSAEATAGDLGFGVQASGGGVPRDVSQPGSRPDVTAGEGSRRSHDAEVKTGRRTRATRRIALVGVLAAISVALVVALLIIATR